MAEEKDTPEITTDDLSTLSYLLQNVKGLRIVSSTDHTLPTEPDKS